MGCFKKAVNGDAVVTGRYDPTDGPPAYLPMTKKVEQQACI